MWDERSEDIPWTYDDSEPAGSVNTQAVVVPSQRHLELYRLLRSNSHRDRTGRLVSWWPQAKLAARLGVSVRTLQNLLADLRQPGPDPRHPKRAAGLRLGLVRVEPTTYRDQATGRHRLGGNLYVLDPGQHARLKAAVTSSDSGDVACLNKGTPLSLEREVSSPGVTGVSSTEAPPVPAVLEVGQQRPLQRLEYDPTRGEVLAALEAGLGPVEVMAEWRNDQPPGHPTYTTARGRVLDLADGSLADFHRAVDQLDRDTCRDGGCHPGHPCRRHTRRKKR